LCDVFKLYLGLRYNLLGLVAESTGRLARFDEPNIANA